MNDDISIRRLQVLSILTNTREIIDWGLQSLGISELWRQTEGEGIKIAILDSGIDDRHPDLAGAVVDGKDFTNSSFGVYDRLGHGTHVAGIVAARSNHIGVIGVAPKSELFIAKVINEDGKGNSEIVAEAVEWAVEKRVDVISLSLGSQNPNDRLHEAICVAVSKNIIIIAAAGNCGSYYWSTINYPACYKEVISVGSINRERQRSAYSAGGEELDIMAPGEEVYSCYPMGMYAKLSGTSMATPFVSGVVALCLAKHHQHKGETPCTNYVQMREHLRDHAIDLGKIGPDPLHGYGLIDPRSLIGEKNNHN